MKNINDTNEETATKRLHRDYTTLVHKRAMLLDSTGSISKTSQFVRSNQSCLNIPNC